MTQETMWFTHCKSFWGTTRCTFWTTWINRTLVAEVVVLSMKLVIGSSSHLILFVFKSYFEGFGWLTSRVQCWNKNYHSPTAGSLGSSAIVKVSGQDGAPFRRIPPVPNRVPNTVPNRVLNRVLNRVPNRVLNRVPSRVPNRVPTQQQVPNRVLNRVGFPTGFPTGFPRRLTVTIGFPKQGSQQGSQ